MPTYNEMYFHIIFCHNILMKYFWNTFMSVLSKVSHVESTGMGILGHMVKNYIKIAN